MSVELKRIIEGILFVCGDDGITLTKLSDLVDVDEDTLKQYLNDFMDEYNNNEERGISLVNYGNKYKFVSKAEIHSYIERLFDESQSKQFSQAALETLAIIAYKQPITRVEIEEIRGVSCDLMIRKLIAKGLVKEAGRLDTIGLPFVYEVTEQFMDTFSLKSLDELPELPDYSEKVEESELF